MKLDLIKTEQNSKEEWKKEEGKKMLRVSSRAFE